MVHVKITINVGWLVGLFAGLRKNHSTHFHKIWWKGGTRAAKLDFGRNPYHSICGNSSCRWRPFSPQTPVLYFGRPDRSVLGCSTDLHWLSRFSGSRSPHLEHATTACHLCLIVDFKLHLKLHLFCFSFPGLSPLWLLSGPCSLCCHKFRPL